MRQCGRLVTALLSIYLSPSQQPWLWDLTMRPSCPPLPMDKLLRLQHCQWWAGGASFINIPGWPREQVAAQEYWDLTSTLQPYRFMFESLEGAVLMGESSLINGPSLEARLLIGVLGPYLYITALQVHIWVTRGSCVDGRILIDQRP